MKFAMNSSKSNFSYKFCAKRVLEIKKLISTSTTISVVGMPGLGISLFLKHLPFVLPVHSIYIDVSTLINLSSFDLFKNLLIKLGGRIDSMTEEEIVEQCMEKLQKLTLKNKKVLVCFSSFDQLKNYLSPNFFHNLKSIISTVPGEIILLFGICKRIDSLLSDNHINSDFILLSNIYYLKPYSEEDLVCLLSQYGQKEYGDEQFLKAALSLSGGNFQLLQLILRSERINDPLNDPFIKLALNNIYQSLSYGQKKTLKKFATYGKYQHDDYLESLGIIKKGNGKYEFFSSLFEKFVKSQISLKLPVKEAQLFRILKNNLAKVVLKEALFKEVWNGDAENASDWALDSLIYRLRRNQVFTSKGYVIENHKKQGYVLLKK